MKQWLRTLLATGAAALMAAGFLTATTFLATTPAKAAGSLVQVTNFGSDPSSSLMYIYVPADVRPDPPILKVPAVPGNAGLARRPKPPRHGPRQPAVRSQQ